MLAIEPAVSHMLSVIVIVIVILPLDAQAQVSLSLFVNPPHTLLVGYQPTSIKPYKYHDLPRDSHTRNHILSLCRCTCSANAS